MSLWIKRDVLLPRNRKTYQLAELLARGGTDLFGGRDEIAWRAIAMTLLEQFWAHVAEHYPKGDVTAAPTAELRDAVRPWLDGTSWACRDVRELLGQSGHIVVTRRGRHLVRDWAEWTGSDMLRLANDWKRKRLARAKESTRRPRTVRGRSAGQTALAEQREEKQSRAEKSVAAEAGGGDPLAQVSRWAELRARLPASEHREALDGFARAASDPVAFTASVLAEGPDTGTQAQAGVTWADVGQALLDMRAAGAPFRPAVFRGYVRYASQHRANGGTSEADRMRAAARQHGSVA